jgi:prepilin-type N-terminal cleavage/methylation domain-containing protein
MKSTRKLRRAGITLLELLIVIAVIAILASILIPSIKGMMQEGDIVAAKGDITTLKTAVESYYMHHDRTYPTSLTFLINTTPKLVPSLPDDRFKKTGTYEFETGDGYYIIYSKGPNGDKDFVLKGEGEELYIDKTSLDDDIVVSNLPIQ